MLEVVERKLAKQRVFQTLLLHNDRSQEVEVQEGAEIDFLRLWDHLSKGGSAFITSKNTQKLRMQERKGRRNRKESEMKTITTFFFDHI